MEMQLSEIAERIRGLRGMLGLSEAEMAAAADVTEDEYRTLEKGETDFPFTFLLKCAERFGVDIVELLTGTNPKLSFYTVTRHGRGLPVARRKGFDYRHLSYLFKDKLAETFLVTAPYSEEEQGGEVHESTHDGQEFDYILSGRLRVVLDGHEELLGEGDSIYYNSGYPHGMIAIGGSDCVFLAVVLKAPDAEQSKKEKK